MLVDGLIKPQEALGLVIVPKKNLSFGASRAVYAVKYREKTYYNLSL